MLNYKQEVNLNEIFIKDFLKLTTDLNYVFNYYLGLDKKLCDLIDEVNNIVNNSFKADFKELVNDEYDNGYLSLFIFSKLGDYEPIGVNFFRYQSNNNDLISFIDYFKTLNCNFLEKFSVDDVLLCENHIEDVYNILCFLMKKEKTLKDIIKIAKFIYEYQYKNDNQHRSKEYINMFYQFTRELGISLDEMKCIIGKEGDYDLININQMNPINYISYTFICFLINLTDDEIVMLEINGILSD